MRTDKQQTEYILRLRDEALTRRKNTKRLKKTPFLEHKIKF